MQSLRSLVTLSSVHHGGGKDSDSTIELGSADAMKIHGVDTSRFEASATRAEHSDHMPGYPGTRVEHEVTQLREHC